VEQGEGPVQQWPVPLTPQIPEMQLSLAVHVPVASGATQDPWLQTNPVAQSAATEQLLRQPFPAALQARLSRQAAGFPTQAPAPLHLLVVRIPALHVTVPQVTAVVG
jgi:hypothetical protein